MKKLIKLLFSLIIILVGAALIAPFLIPMETYKKQAVAMLSDATGRDIAIDGDISFRLLPDVAVVLNKVTIGNSAGFKSPYLAKVENIDIGVALGPLFRKELVIQKFKLNKPDINLETNKLGNGNWQIKFKAPELPKVEFISNAYANTNEQGFTFKKLELSQLSIKDGKLTYLTGDKKQLFEDVNLASDAVHMNKPTDIEGHMIWNGEEFSFKTRITSLEDLSNNVATNAIIGIHSKHVKASISGMITQTSLRGTIDAGSPSVVKMMEWVGSPIEWDSTPLLFAVKGKTTCNRSYCDISDAVIAIDDMRLNGKVAVNYSRKPYISGDIKTDELDFSDQEEETDALLRHWHMISSAHAAADWDTETIDLSGLNAFDLDLAVDAKKVVLPNMRLDNVKVKPQIKNGAASLNIVQSNVFSGTMTGAVTAIPRDSYINSSARLTLKNIEMEEMIEAFDGEDSITGKANLTTSLVARGNSVASIIQTLSGSGTFEIRDGAIKGVNIGQMARNVKSAFTKESTTEQTDFAELTGAYTITNGVIANNDLYMKAPLIRMRGQGQVNLPLYTINYRLLPEIVETSKGQGGKDKTGILVPVLVTGALDDPQFAPDLQAILQDEELMKKNIGAVKDTIKDKKQEIKDVKKQFKDIKKDLKEDPSKLLEDPKQLNDQINNLLKGF